LICGNINRLKPHNQIDFILVGYGIAGYFFAKKIVKEGFSVKVYNTPDLAISSSAIAFPLLNPLALKRLSPSWRMKETLNYLQEDLPDHDTAQLHRMVYNNDFKPWNQRRVDYGLENYISPIPESSLSDAYSWMQVSNTYKGYKPPVVSTEMFRSDLLSPSDSLYDNTKYKYIVFCEGIHVLKNPYFSVPIFPSRGVVIRVRIKGVRCSSKVFSGRGIFIGQDGDNTFFIGATHNLFSTQIKIDIDEIEALMDKAVQLLNIHKSNISLVSADTANRPTTRDRKPIIGTHSHYPNMCILNGLGARGYSISSMLSEYLFNHLIHKGEIPQDMCISRFNT